MEQDSINDYLKNLFQRYCANPRIAITIVLDAVEKSTDNYWEVISKVPLTEPFPVPSRGQVENLIKCCERILQSEYFSSAEEKVAQIFYSLIKNHYLNNGNKRFACTITIVLVQAIGIEKKHRGEPYKESFFEKREQIMELALGVANEKGNDHQKYWIEKIKKVLFDE